MARPVEGFRVLESGQMIAGRFCAMLLADRGADVIKMTVRNAVRFVVIALASATAMAQPARTYPVKPIRIVVPYAPGGPMDFIGQTLAARMGPALGQNMFIDNRTGAGGAIGTDAVAKAAPDGYTLLHSSNSHTTLASLIRNLPYDPVKDFVPVSLLMRSVGYVLAVHPSVPARSVKELVALAKAHPGELNYGSGGIGNTMHFAAEQFSMAAGTKLAHVPYKGVGQAIIDLVGGRIELCFLSARSALALVRAGKLRALGISARERWSELPDVPTIDEAGVKGFVSAAWYGFWFPAATPNEYVLRINTEAAKAMEDPATRRKLTDEGLVPVASSPQAFASAIAEEIEMNRKLVARIGLQPQ
jgi:tripartite-type tricarboxylate transporter receptor subunit TctC